MNGVSVYRSFQGTRAAIRNQVLPIFPTNFNSLKSGRGFHESVNAAITKEYRKTLLTRKVNPMTKEEAEQDTPPMFWEYKNKPWYYSLATKIFRRHLQLAPNVKDVAGDPANAPVLKAAQKRLAQFKSSGLGHFAGYLHNWKNLYLYLQQGWEVMNLLIRNLLLQTNKPWRWSSPW